MAVSVVEPYPSRHIRVIGNPAPLGLFCFGSNALISSLFSVQVRHIIVPNVIVAVALGGGGCGLLVAGQWEFLRGNTFRGSAFSSYAGFWISYALIYLPTTGVLAAYQNDPTGELDSALGIYFMAWFILSAIFLAAALRTNVLSISLFSCITIKFFLLGLGTFFQSSILTKVAGGFGIGSAAFAYYSACSQLLNKHNEYITLPVGQFLHHHDHDHFHLQVLHFKSRDGSRNATEDVGIPEKDSDADSNDSKKVM
ncbi:hypothetical protein M422DRAFT_199319 [Sphaerobolus stellatus SS14]|nr:hypothetical protein M422DRAFT_199319 [Sphaerobolus stellatus SS14]